MARFSFCSYFFAALMGRSFLVSTAAAAEFPGCRYARASFLLAAARGGISKNGPAHARAVCMCVRVCIPIRMYKIACAFESCEIGPQCQRIY